jgi:spore photoproduct lyase
LDALAKLQQKGWLVGLRFDPLIYQDNYMQHYRQLFAQVFQIVDLKQLHSVSVGVFRLPEKFFRKIHTLYPEEKLLAAEFVNRSGLMTYQQTLEQEMMHYCSELILSYIPKDKFFPCQL